MLKEKKTAVLLYEEIHQSILNEFYPAGYQLPPMRRAAMEFNVCSATVMKVYNRLEDEGLIEKRGGSGCYVNYNPSDFEFSDDDESLRMEILATGKNIINFASGSLSSELFPVVQFKECLIEVLDRDGGEAFHYHDSQGYAPLREKLALELEKEEIFVDRGGVQIVSGSQQAIDLIVRTLVRKGDLIMMENPGYPGAIGAFRRAGARIASLPVYQDGFSLVDVEEIAKRGEVRLLYTTSTYQNPSGVTLSFSKKEKLVALAKRYDFLIIEDDCVSDLYYDGEKSPLIKRFDSTERVIYIKSYSKIFMPGLRLGLMTLPKGLRTRFIAAKYSTDIANSGLNQRGFDHYLRKGHLEEHSRMVRNKMAQRFSLMRSAIDCMRGASLCYTPAGGLYFWMRLNNPQGDIQTVIDQKTEILIQTGKIMSPNRRSNNFFRLSFAAVPIEQITHGIEKLDRLIKDSI